MKHVKWYQGSQEYSPVPPLVTTLGAEVWILQLYAVVDSNLPTEKKTKQHFQQECVWKTRIGIYNYNILIY